jgi:hypothetical protein
MRIKIEADGKTLYTMQVQSLLRVEALKGHIAAPLPKDGKLDVYVEFEPGIDQHDQALAGDTIHARIPATLPTDDLDD